MNHEQLMQRVAQQISAILDATSKAKCQYIIMDEAYYGNLAIPQLSQDNRGHQLCVGDAYMVITCANGYMYYVNVSADSALTACAEVFQFVQYKL